MDGDPLNGLDLTSDLSQGADPFGGQPYNGDAVSPNQIPNKTVEEHSEEAPAPEKSLRETLTEAFKGKDPPLDAGDRQAGEQAPLSPVGEAPPVAPDLVKVGERWHNKDGTFASKEQIDAYTAAQAAATGQPAPAQELPPFTSRFTEVEKQQYAALTPELRTFVDRTMDSVAQQAAQFGEYSQLEQLIGPRRQAWSQEGMNPYAALNGLLQLSDFAGRDPGEFVLWFADQHQIDLDAILDARDEAIANSGVADPRLNTLVEEVSQLRNTINGFTTQANDQTVQSNYQVIQQFMAEKDASGQLKYPYYMDVAANIGQFVNNIRATQPFLSPYDTLKAAYDFACYNDPAVRGKIQAADQAAIAAKKVQEAERARLAGSSINGGPAGGDSGNSTNPSRTLREELAYNYNRSVAG